MEPLEILKKEHSTVLMVVEAARRDLAVAVEAQHVDGEEVEKLLDFFRYFTNSCHEPKEEDLLFAVLHRRGLAWEGYPLSDLVQDHTEMRVVLDSASDWLPLARHGDTCATLSLLQDLQTYLDLVELHIAKEEKIVFPIAAKWLTPQDFDELTKAFSVIACDELDEGIHAYYADLAQQLAGAAAAA
jgi:hemerythrin-like domain-containing protein